MDHRQGSIDGKALPLPYPSFLNRLILEPTCAIVLDLSSAMQANGVVISFGRICNISGCVGITGTGDKGKEPAGGLHA